MSFKIIVDSCCDLTPAQFREGCFVRVPLTIRVGDHTIVDDASFDQGDLLWRMKESETAPQSACPSPIQYLLELRMRHACALLEESDLTIDQIAAATGFCDSNYFLKLYKRKFGISAGKARRKNAGSLE